jgi:hypothetical protein
MFNKRTSIDTKLGEVNLEAYSNSQQNTKSTARIKMRKPLYRNQSQELQYYDFEDQVAE